MKQRILTFWLCLLAFAATTRANNLVITNMALVNINLPAGTMDISFDIGWENSWRVGTGPANWDAAWVFAKYHTADGLWKHVRLSTTGTDHAAPAGSTIQVGTTSGAGVGAFIHRSANGAGNISWTGVRLRWPFTTQGVLTNDLLTVSVLGIEMVYVPQGAFWVGDGAGLTNRWHNGTSSNAFQITSEGALILNNTAGNIWDNAITNTALKGTTIPAAFPKGFQPFYCMKYEVSGEQYDRYEYHQGIESPPYSGSTSVSAQSNYQRDNAGSFNEITFLRTNAQANTYGYLSWSGLRPMTEFEYEKACRGPVNPIPGEFAWGTGLISSGTYGYSGSGNTQTVSSGYSTIAGNATPNGTHRVGIFARTSYSNAIGSASPRVQSGATYWGILDMTGNVAEPVIVAFKRAVSTSQTNGLTFTGSHGTGELPVPTNWPAESIYSRGGGWDVSQARAISDRTETLYQPPPTAVWQAGFGYRGARTAP